MLVQVFLFTVGLVYSQAPGACFAPNPQCNCPCDYGHCHWWGDPHTNTFDGLWHHYQGNNGRSYRYVSPCPNVSTRPGGDFSQMPFQILAQHRACGWWGALTCTNNVQIRLHSNAVGNPYLRTITLLPGLIATDSTTILPINDGTYIYSGWNSYYKVTRTWWFIEFELYTGKLCNYPDQALQNVRPDVVVRATWSLNRVDVNLNEYYKYQTCGLCGYWSGTHHDDFTLPDCSQRDSSVPQNMWDYTPADWLDVNTFGNNWADAGIGNRRLQDEFEFEDIVVEQQTGVTSECAEAVRSWCRDSEWMIHGESFCSGCAAEVCGQSGDDCDLADTSCFNGYAIDHCTVACIGEEGCPPRCQNGQTNGPCRPVRDFDFGDGAFDEGFP